MKQFLFALVLLAAPAFAGDGLSPEETVKKYLAAVKANDFKTAYRCVSRGMAMGKSEEEWVKAQQWVMQMSEAKVLDFRVYPGKIEGDKAYVPNLLSSQDKYLNQLGVEEHELYTLIKEDGEWRIDQQQLLIEGAEKAKWFPAEKK